MALKPDVTLSIVKNTAGADTGLQKLYYNENVYRVSPGAKAFRELMQVGLECIGTIDDYCISEVVLLAAESLLTVSEEGGSGMIENPMLNDASRLTDKGHEPYLVGRIVAPKVSV